MKSYIEAARLHILHLVYNRYYRYTIISVMANGSGDVVLDQVQDNGQIREDNRGGRLLVVEGQPSGGTDILVCSDLHEIHAAILQPIL